MIPPERLRRGGPQRGTPAPPLRQRADRPVRGVRGREAPAALARLRRPARRLRARDRNRRRVRRRATLAFPRPLRRRVPGRHPPAGPAPAGVAGRPLRALRGRRRRSGDLRVRRRRRRAAHGVPRALPRRTHGRARVQLPVDRVDRQCGRGRGLGPGARVERDPPRRGAAGRTTVHDHRVRRR